MAENAPPRRSTLREYLEALLIAAIFLGFTNTFVVKTFFIPSGSMEDTLLVGDHLFVNKFIYGPEIPLTGIHLPGFRAPRRGDVVVFTYPDDPGTTYIKRVIGTPGDTLRIDGRRLEVNGATVSEPYTKHIVARLRPPRYQEAGIQPPGAGNLDYYGPVVIPPDHYFMMGDNRENSEDSRFRGFIASDQIKGKAEVLYWSWDPEGHHPRLGRLGDLIR